jgi:hypothetical protein
MDSSGDHVFHNGPSNARQPKVSTGMVVRQLLVIETHQVQHGRM